jgi:hypothetical protein
MNSWRDYVLKEFTPHVARLTLVADPDGLLLEEGILEGIRERHFELLSFDDHIAFRYAYESNFRSRWDRGEHTDLVVVVRSQENDLRSLPYDLLQAGRTLYFSLADIFPNLSYPVIAALDRGDLDALYEAQIHHAPGKLGDNATKEFVLRHVFGIAPELIKQPSDLLRVLLRRHSEEQRIPRELETRFIELLRQNGQFGDWPLETLVTDRETFFTFLQERWPIFIAHEAGKIESCTYENASPVLLKINGPINLPFDHHDIRGYIENCFMQGFLQPIPHESALALAATWVGIGIKRTTLEEKARHLTKLIDTLEASLPTENAKHTDWFRFAHGWAELRVMRNELSAQHETALERERLSELEHRVDERFTGWVQRRFAGLIQLPSNPPVMVHHILRFLANTLSGTPPAKIALLVLDGLALDQWLVIREVLTTKNPRLHVREQTVFAWIPSLTSVSRQAMFAGKAPLFFPNSIETTDKEPSLWTQFWVDQGFSPKEVVYIKGLGDGDVDTVSEALSHPEVRIAGLVVDKVDKIMHGMQLGTAGMHSLVSQWANQSYLNTLINLLLDHGFRIYLTSDHGNIHAEGCGRPTEGSIADMRGERVRIYSDPMLRNKVKESFPDALEWGAVGLPENYCALLAPHRKAFIQEGQSAVCHGGISVEELIVPFIQIDRKTE